MVCQQCCEVGVEGQVVVNSDDCGEPPLLVNDSGHFEHTRLRIIVVFLAFGPQNEQLLLSLLQLRLQPSRFLLAGLLGKL